MRLRNEHSRAATCVRMFRGSFFNRCHRCGLLVRLFSPFVRLDHRARWRSGSKQHLRRFRRWMQQQNPFGDAWRLVSGIPRFLPLAGFSSDSTGGANLDDQIPPLWDFVVLSCGRLILDESESVPQSRLLVHLSVERVASH